MRTTLHESAHAVVERVLPPHRLSRTVVYDGTLNEARKGHVMPHGSGLSIRRLARKKAPVVSKSQRARLMREAETQIRISLAGYLFEYGGTASSVGQILKWMMKPLVPDLDMAISLARLFETDGERGWEWLERLDSECNDLEKARSSSDHLQGRLGTGHSTKAEVRRLGVAHPRQPVR